MPGRRAGLIAVLAALALPAGAQAASPPGKDGRWITGADGRVLIAHGFNMVAKLAPYTAQSVGFGEDDAELLADNGFNLVRLGVMWSAAEPQPGAYDDAYLDQVAETVALLARHGISTLVDFHQDGYSERVGGQGFPAWAVPAGADQNAAWDAFWDNGAAPDGVALWERFALFWRHLAERFRGDPWVIGYDLMNEPGPGTQGALCLNPLVCPFDATLGRFYRFVIPRIRAADPEHLVFYEPSIYAGAGGAQDIDHGGDARAVLSFHNYCTITAVTSGGLEQERQSLCPLTEQATFAAAERQAARNGDASVMTEFGSVPTVAEIVRVAAGADARRVGWTEWTFHNTGHTNFAGEYSIARDPRRPPRGDNVNASLLRALARPYPQAVAGTPEAWSFDPQTRRFALRFRTRRADGHGSFAAGALTRVVVPRLQYPDGYAVTVSGATIATPARSRLLDLRSAAGADVVTVGVQPGAGSFPRGSAAVRVRASWRRGALVVTGRLTPPDGTDAADGCKGRVAITIRRARRTVAPRMARLRADCGFRAVARLRRTSGLRVSARFAGNALLLPATARAARP